MLPSFLRASFIASVVSAVSVSAAPSLTAEVSTLNVRAHGLENLKVTTTVTNAGDETLKLPNDPRGVLSSFHKDSFSITNDADSRPSFNDAKIRFSPTYAANLDDPDGDDTPKNLFATVEDSAKDTLSGGIAVSRVRDRRAFATNCSIDQQLAINAAVAEAQTLVTNAASYIIDVKPEMDAYVTWLGHYDPNRALIPLSHYALMGSHAFYSLTYYCSCNDSSSAAYVDANRYGDMYLCPPFWNLPTSGFGTMAGMLIHEASHFHVNGGTQNYTLNSQTAAQALAKANPDLCVKNADNHQYFAESLTQ